MSTIGNRTDIWLSKCTSVQISNTTKVCVQNALRVLECKLEDVDATAWLLHRWTPGGNVPTLRSGQRSGCDTHAPAASPNLVVYRVQVGLLAGHRAEAIKSGVSLIAARSHAPCGQERCHVETKEAARQVLETEIFCYRYLKITPLSNNIFSWNFAFLSQIHSKTSALNFIRIYSDLAFLSHIV